MAQIFTQIITYMRETSLSFDFNGTLYSFTFMDIAVGLAIIELGIYIVARILNND